MSLRPPVEVTWFVPLLAIAASLMAAASRAPGALRPRNLRWHRQSGRLAPSLRPGPRSRAKRWGRWPSTAPARPARAASPGRRRAGAADPRAARRPPRQPGLHRPAPLRHGARRPADRPALMSVIVGGRVPHHRLAVRGPGLLALAPATAAAKSP